MDWEEKQEVEQETEEEEEEEDIDLQYEADSGIDLSMTHEDVMEAVKIFQEEVCSWRTKVKTAERRTPISAKLVFDKCIDASTVDQDDDDAFTDAIIRVTHLRLGHCNIGELANLEPYTDVTHAYFNNNYIPAMCDDLEWLLKLQVLILSHNLLSKIEYISQLPKLQLLDVSHNNITTVTRTSLPESLRHLYISGNPIEGHIEGLEDSPLLPPLASHLPNLHVVDTVTISNMMRIQWKAPLNNGILAREEEEQQHLPLNDTSNTPRSAITPPLKRKNTPPPPIRKVPVNPNLSKQTGPQNGNELVVAAGGKQDNNAQPSQRGGGGTPPSSTTGGSGAPSVAQPSETKTQQEENRDGNSKWADTATDRGSNFSSKVNMAIHQTLQSLQHEQWEKQKKYFDLIIADNEETTESLSQAVGVPMSRPGTASSHSRPGSASQRPGTASSHRPSSAIGRPTSASSVRSSVSTLPLNTPTASMKPSSSELPNRQTQLHDKLLQLAQHKSKVASISLNDDFDEGMEKMRRRKNEMVADSRARRDKLQQQYSERLTYIQNKKLEAFKNSTIQ